MLTSFQVNVDIVIANFRLGLNGGPTLFNLITRLNNGVQAPAQSPHVTMRRRQWLLPLQAQMDEALNFRSGFRLPGRAAWQVGG